MKRKIILLLFALFAFFTIGTVIAMLYITNSTAELKHIIKLNEIEQLRRTLIINIQTVQTDLYTVNTKFGHKLDSLTNNMINLEQTAKKCSSCHHPPRLSKRIEKVQSLIGDYERALNYYITGSSNSDRIEELKLDAAAIGDKLINLTEGMSHSASNNLKELTNNTMIKIKDARSILFITDIITFLLGIIVAVNLTKSITHPINKLVNATRMISSGKLGTTISYKNNSEFGELAEHFNAMSTAIKDGYAKIREEMAERKKTEEQLHHGAFHDSLTGLPNRALFMDRLDHVVDREKRNKEYLFAVLFIDMDRFKVLNDSLGHTVGDKLLIAVSQRLAESLRPGDTVARFGGDEFAILLEDLKDRDEALLIADRIQEKLSLPFNLNGQEVFSSASIGITFNATDYNNLENILRDADIAMYHAKSNGSARYEIFDTGMYNNVFNRLKLETDLRQAIKQNEFRLHYQPIISMQTGRITGLESLIRWQHPVNGLIYPAEFVPTAEETGLIVPIGEWTLYEACRRLRIWQEKFPANPPLTMSVNISSKQLLPDLIKHIKQVLQETGIEPSSLILEITESMIMENAETVAPLLLQLKDINVKLHIDDFGTGYSSLSYLHHFPVDVLKIDRSFVARLGFNGDNMEIVKAITTLAHSLNMNIIAEGVETVDQIAQLRTLKCEYMQGYFFSKPLDGKEIENLLCQSQFNLSALYVIS